MTEDYTLFGKVPYDCLNAKQKELVNFQKIAATFAECGFNCIKLADDWQGADFLACHMNSTFTLKVQLKSRLTIDQKYRGPDKDIWIAFPHKKYWYLIKHDLLVDKIGEHTTSLQSNSWTIKGGYHSTSINSDLLESLAKNRLGPIYGDLAV